MGVGGGGMAESEEGEGYKLKTYTMLQCARMHEVAATPEHMHALNHTRTPLTCRRQTFLMALRLATARP